MEVHMKKRVVSNNRVFAYPKCSGMELMRSVLLGANAPILLLDNGYIAIRNDICRLLDKFNYKIDFVRVDSEFGTDFVEEGEINKNIIWFDKYRVRLMPDTGSVRDDIRAILEGLADLSYLGVVEFDITDGESPCER